MASNLPHRERGSAAAIVAALLLPPLGVYLMRGLSPAFWIGTALTCIGIVPGIVFALLTVSGLLPRPRARSVGAA